MGRAALVQFGDTQSRERISDRCHRLERELSSTGSLLETGPFRFVGTSRQAAPWADAFSHTATVSSSKNTPESAAVVASSIPGTAEPTKALAAFT